MIPCQFRCSVQCYIYQARGGTLLMQTTSLTRMIKSQEWSATQFCLSQGHALAYYLLPIIILYCYIFFNTTHFHLFCISIIMIILCSFLVKNIFMFELGTCPSLLSSTYYYFVLLYIFQHNSLSFILYKHNNDNFVFILG